MFDLIADTSLLFEFNSRGQNMGSDNATGNANFDVLFYANPQPMWVFDVHTLRILEVNESAVKIYGYNKSEFLAMTVRDLRPPEDIPIFMEILPSITDDDGTHYREMRHLTKSGKVLHVEIISYGISFEDKRARIVYARSADEKKELVGKLRLTQSRLLHILETTIIGFIQMEANWTITYWNKAAESLIGYQRDDVLGRNFWHVLPEIVHSDFCEYFKHTMLTRKNTDFVDHFWPRQKWFNCNAYASEKGITVHFMDITSRRLSRHALQEKVDQLKEISFINSHALRKPIASLMGLTHLVNHEVIKPQEFKDIALLIHECSLELDEVVKEVNRRVSDDEHFSTLDNDPGVFDFGKMVEDVVAKVSTLYLPSQISITGNISKNYYGIRQSIEFALMYLIDNAARFSAPGSNILVNTELVNQNLVLSVRDHGKGMDAERLHKLFVLLNDKKGVTLEMGLPKINEICRRHHGDMWIESKAGAGSTFYMRFPLSNIAAYLASGHIDLMVYKKPDVEVEYDAEHHCIRANWINFHDRYTIRDGCKTILDKLKAHKCQSLLNVNAEVIGGWIDACDWLVRDWFPNASGNGLKYLAWVSSPNTFGRLSAQYTIDNMASPIFTQSFDDEATAIAWLNGLSSVGK